MGFDPVTMLLGNNAIGKAREIVKSINSNYSINRVTFYVEELILYLTKFVIVVHLISKKYKMFRSSYNYLEKITRCLERFVSFDKPDFSNFLARLKMLKGSFLSFLKM